MSVTGPTTHPPPYGDLGSAFQEVYPQLRRLAGSWWYREPKDHSLTPTAVVHEAYLALRRSPPDPERGRAYFFASAALAMRRVLVTHARRRARRIPKTQSSAPRTAQDRTHEAMSILDLDAGLTSLQRRHPRAAQVAQLRLFTGLNTPAIAALLGVSERTILFDWRFARAHLRDTLESGHDHGQRPA